VPGRRTPAPDPLAERPTAATSRYTQETGRSDSRWYHERVTGEEVEPERVRLDRERSAALHAAVADKLVRDPAILERARRKLRDWLDRGGRSQKLWQRWEEILAGTPEDVARFLRDPSAEATWLRKASPFAGVLTPTERWRILREVRERLEQTG